MSWISADADVFSPNSRQTRCSWAWVSQLFSGCERVFFRNAEGLSDSSFGGGIYGIKVSDGPAGIRQPIDHRPNTSSWDFTLPALWSRRASRMLRRYAGDEAAIRSSKKIRRSFFFIFLTAWITVAGVTSMRNVLDTSDLFRSITQTTANAYDLLVNRRRWRENRFSCLER